MSKRFLLLAIVTVAGAAGCGQTPVQPAARNLQIAGDQLAPPTDSSSRGGNVMGSGH